MFGPIELENYQYHVMHMRVAIIVPRDIHSESDTQGIARAYTTKGPLCSISYCTAYTPYTFYFIRKKYIKHSYQMVNVLHTHQNTGTTHRRRQKKNADDERAPLLFIWFLQNGQNTITRADWLSGKWASKIENWLRCVQCSYVIVLCTLGRALSMDIRMHALVVCCVYAYHTPQRIKTISVSHIQTAHIVCSSENSMNCMLMNTEQQWMLCNVCNVCVYVFLGMFNVLSYRYARRGNKNVSCRRCACAK